MAAALELDMLIALRISAFDFKFSEVKSSTPSANLAPAKAPSIEPCLVACFTTTDFSITLERCCLVVMIN